MKKFFKVILNHKIKDNYVYLPSEIIEQINANLRIEEKQFSFNIVKLKIMNVDNAIYLANTGGVSSKEKCIEISHYFGKSLRIKNGDYAKIIELEIKDHELIDNLELEPLTHFDYKIIEANPEFFEENMLNQLLVAYDDLVFPFVFSDNTVVYLKVKSNKKNKPLLISQDCEVEVSYKKEEKTSELQNEKRIFFNFTSKIFAKKGLSGMFQIPTINISKSMLEKNKINLNDINQIFCQISLFKPEDLVNKEKAYYNIIFSRLCEFQSLHKFFSNSNNYQSIIEQIISKFPYFHSIWINLKVNDENQDSISLDEFLFKFNTLIYDSDEININLFNFDFENFNFNIYNEFLIKFLTIEYYYIKNITLALSTEKIEKLIKEYINEFIDINSFLVLNNKFYFILDIESSNFSQIYSENIHYLSDLKNKIILYVNLNTNTNEYMNLLIKIGKLFNFSKYDNQYENDRVFKSLILIRSREVVEKITFKFNNEVKIFCYDNYHNKINRHVFGTQISSIFNHNNFYQLLNNYNAKFMNLYKEKILIINSNIDNFFNHKSQNFINFIFGPKQVGKTLLIRHLIYDNNDNNIFTNILEEESNVFIPFQKNNKKFNYINLNFLGLNIKVFKKYIKSFFECKFEGESIYIIDGLNCLSNKIYENGNNQKEVINYLAFKILTFIKTIRKKNKALGNNIFIIFVLNSVSDIPDIFKNSKFLYELIHLNFLEKSQCEHILKIILSDTFISNIDNLNKDLLSKLSDYTKCFVVEDFCRIYNSLQVDNRKKNISFHDKLVEIISNYTPINLDSNKKIALTNNFLNVGGLKMIKDEIYNTISLSIQFFERFKEKPPIKLSSGILLYGPSGCGKTLIASCIQNEFKINFFSIKGPEILNKYIGSSEARIREIFENAKKVIPCVIFFDEFDSIAPKRGSGSSGVTDRIVNQLLCYLDGIESREGVFVMAATSKPDLIDPAVLRPGRIEKILYCGFPNEEERKEIIILYLLKIIKEISQEILIAIEEIASKTEYYSGADLQNIVNEAHLIAIHEIKDLSNVERVNITQSNLIESYKNSKKSVVNADIEYFNKYNKNFIDKLEEDISQNISNQKMTLF